MLHEAGGTLLTLGTFACRDNAEALTDMLGTKDVWFWSSQQAEKQEFVQWAGRVLEHRCVQSTDTCLKAADGCLLPGLGGHHSFMSHRGLQLYMFTDLPGLLVLMILAPWGHYAQEVCH